MSILIKGMEMPTWCNDCPFNDKEYDVCVATTDRRSIRIPVWERMRLFHCEKWCPLVPVPYHGNLIDREALKKSLVDGCETMGIDGFSVDGLSADDICHAIENAPVVIPAERS